MAVANGINPTFDKVNIGNSGTNTAVTQATSTATAVRINAATGVITMFGPTATPAGGESTFDLLSSQITAKSVIPINVASGSVGGLRRYSLRVPLQVPLRSFLQTCTLR